MDNNNSSNSNDPLSPNNNSFDFDEDLLQWLTNLPPITPPNTTTTLEQLDHPKVVNPIGDPPPRNVVAGSSSGKGKQGQSEKIKAVEIERLRRQEMSSLYRSLRSILPAEYIRGKRSTADHLNGAVRYIKDMEGNIGKLTEKRDALLKGKTGSSSRSSSSSNNNNVRQHYVAVNKCREGFFQIVLRTNGVNFEENQRTLPLSKALYLLSKEGFSVTNSISSRIGNNLMHTIHAEVDDKRVIDPCVLQQQLLNCYV
ncbi:hypothetical protein RND81_13G043700 [Saponaria officinalis]|uniref:BHLH domain-containing protein n=1 Tax=Saponaria officinalis TaxID=3572 RepID=A0AAW1H2F8_SAPOF